MGGNPKIPIVEGEQSLPELESILLESTGYQIVGASSSAEAPAIAARQRPDPVPLDIARTRPLQPVQVTGMIARLLGEQ